jgi:glutamine synthetase
VKDLSVKAAAEMSPEERTELGVKDRMSLSIEEARQRFKEDAVLRELLGSEFVDAYLRVNEVSSLNRVILSSRRQAHIPPRYRLRRSG